MDYKFHSTFYNGCNYLQPKKCHRWMRRCAWHIKTTHFQTSELTTFWTFLYLSLSDDLLAQQYPHRSDIQLSLFRYIYTTLRNGLWNISNFAHIFIENVWRRVVLLNYFQLRYKEYITEMHSTHFLSYELSIIIHTFHYDVITWKLFPRYWPFDGESSPSPRRIPLTGANAADLLICVHISC